MQIYLKMKPYVAQWCRNEWGDCERGEVTFPKGSAENHILELFLTLPPKGAVPNAVVADDVLVINVPSFRAKPAPYYWWLTEKSSDLLRTTIATRMKLDFWQDIHRFENMEVEISGLIYSWMEQHGIKNDTDCAFECLRQYYYRLKKKYQRESVKNALKRSEMEG